MATKISGVTEVNGFNAVLTVPNSGSTVFLRFPYVSPENRFSRFYGEFIQLLPNYPETSLLAVINYQQIWLDNVEIKINREWGTRPTLLSASWRVQGEPYDLWLF